MTTTAIRRAARALLAGLGVLVATTGLLAATTAPASAGQVGVTVGIRGAGAVTVVEGSIEDGAQLTCQRFDNLDQRVTAWCPRMRNSEAFEAWVWLRATPAFQPAGQWVFDNWSGCDRTRERDGFLECAVHSGAFSSDERYPVAQFLDVVAPEVHGPIASPSAEQDRTFRFVFTATDGATTCRVVNLTEWFGCTTGHSVQVPEGAHAFQVRATDRSGNIDTETVGVIAVDTGVSGGPAALTNDRTPTFDLHTVAGETLWCALDEGPWTACGDGPDASYELPSVGDGEHRLLVQARNGSWIDPVPAQWQWTTDTVAPTTTIAAETLDATARFVLTSPDAVSFECRLDGPAVVGAWTPCPAQFLYIGLGDGPHTLLVRGTDAAGNVEDPAAVHRFTIDTGEEDPGTDPDDGPGTGPVPVPPPGDVPPPADTTPPETSLTSGPSGFVLAPSATFVLAGEAGAGFRCGLDGATVPCGSELRVSGLGSGTHTLTAAAVDTAGNVDPTPVVRTWTVPVPARELRIAKGWKLRRSAAAYGGHRLESSRKGATLSHRVSGARAVALVVGRGARHGTVKVYAGSRLLRTVRLAAPRGSTATVVPVATFATPYTGRLRVVVATQGRAVRIEGLGVATG